MKCRFCNHDLIHECINLHNAPPSNAFLSKEQLNEREIYYPLRLYVCEKCWLVQIDEYKQFYEIFSKDYIYFSSYSTSWLEHAKLYTEMVTERFTLNETSMVIEIGSNDGYLLQYFQNNHIPCLGIEPTESTAKVSKEKGIPVICKFFGKKLAKQLAEAKKKANLLIGNNVLAHVPDVVDFVEGLKIILKKNGVITMEFPHLMQLIEQTQFDTIYHEHFSYFSFHTVKTIFSKQGLEIFDVETLSTHGGSLRIYAKHIDSLCQSISKRVDTLLKKETNQAMLNLKYYKNFQIKVDILKYSSILFLIEQKRKRKTVIAYGAAAKGNTFLNYCGIKKDLIPFVVDASPHKVGKYLPGNHIPVVNEGNIKKVKPSYVIILPWNLKDEIIDQLHYIKSWGGRFVVAIPELQIL